MPKFAIHSLSLLAILSAALVLDAAGPGLRGAESNIKPGQVGIDWYSTWDTGLAEAKRSGRPIMFVAAATQCSGVSGVF